MHVPNNNQKKNKISHKKYIYFTTLVQGKMLQLFLTAQVDGTLVDSLSYAKILNSYHST